MSEVLGLVKFKDGTIKYFVYNGVADINNFCYDEK